MYYGGLITLSRGKRDTVFALALSPSLLVDETGGKWDAAAEEHVEHTQAVADTCHLSVQRYTRRVSMVLG